MKDLDRIGQYPSLNIGIREYWDRNNVLYVLFDARNKITSKYDALSEEARSIINFVAVCMVIAKHSTRDD